MEKARDILRTVFGYKEFISRQAEIIAQVLAGRDTLAVMPTGGGKSLCYQVPALLFDGLTVVVSPLISLMHDQIEQLRENGVAASLLNSALAPAAYRYNVDKVRSRRARLLYVAPETLLRPAVLELLAEAQVRLLAVDEAHCISAWGHDFRPEYRRLTEVRERLPQAVCLALTATATPKVRQDIKTSLELDGAEFIASFDRPNLLLRATLKEQGHRQLLAAVREQQGEAGIIYCPTRQEVDNLCRLLTSSGIAALPYHAGLPGEERLRHQESFSRDEARVMVATVAFGMGIDKSNIRFVIHYGLPKNLESYYQEIGRAGRDGAPARCLLLYSYGDIHKIKYMINQMDPERQRGANLLLSTMLGYAQTEVCRRRVLLEYFGEIYPADSCAMCDNCRAGLRQTHDLTVAGQKLLSCVKRTGESFGVEYVIDVLRGSESRKVMSRGHQRLSTYGIGREFSKEQWRHLARQLLHQGFMSQDQEFGGLNLTPKAWKLFRGKCEFRSTLPEASSGPQDPASTQAPEQAAVHDPELFELLRAKRKALAEAAQVPPYIIFSDKSLHDMASRLPGNQAEFLDIHGVGQAKANSYGEAFIKVIAEYCAARNITRPAWDQVADPSPAPARKEHAGGRRHVEIGAAFSSGSSIAELMTRYGIKRKTVVGHLNTYSREIGPLPGEALLAATILNPDEQQKALAAFAALGCERLRPVYDALEGKVSFDDLHLLRLYFLGTSKANSPAQEVVRPVSGIRHIICLANSRKYSGRCVAGKQWLDGKIGPWLRPVADSPTGELAEEAIGVGPGKPPGLLDILAIPLAAAAPHGCQRENYRIISGQPWQRIGRLEPGRAAELLDRADSLWINGHHSYNGQNDRMPVEEAASLPGSLLFIQPQHFTIMVAPGSDLLKRVRARFQYHGQPYCLGVTDPAIEARFLSQPLGEYELGHDLYLTLSISEPFEGYCYKLVAAVVELPPKN